MSRGSRAILAVQDVRAKLLASPTPCPRETAAKLARFQEEMANQAAAKAQRQQQQEEEAGAGRGGSRKGGAAPKKKKRKRAASEEPEPSGRLRRRVRAPPCSAWLWPTWGLHGWFP